MFLLIKPSVFSGSRRLRPCSCIKSRFIRVNTKVNIRKWSWLTKDWACFKVTRGKQDSESSLKHNPENGLCGQHSLDEWETNEYKYLITSLLLQWIKKLCYSPAGRSTLGKIVPKVLSTLPRAVVKTERIVLTNTHQPTPVNNIFTFFRKKTRSRSCDKCKKANPPEFAGKIKKFRPLLEPIRLHDSCLFEIAPFSCTKLDKYTIFT